MNTLFRFIVWISLVVVFPHSFYSCSTSDPVPEEVEEVEEVEEPEPDSENIDDLMHLAQGYTSSTITPMGKHYESLKVPTEEDLAWLNDPEQEPVIPPGKENDLQLKTFGVKLYPFGDPTPADCNQRALGDCSAISIFAEMAYINPDFIKSIITENEDKSCTVKMFDPQGNPISVTVSNKFMSYKSNGNLAGVNGKTQQATWATVLEKALMKYIDMFDLVGSVEGIGSEYASPAFTGNGNSFAFYPEKLGPEEMKRVVEVSLAEGKLVIGGFNQANVTVGKSKTVTAHAWSFSYAPNMVVNGYEPIFVMRNPWGNDNDTDKDGQMYIPSANGVTSMIDLRIIEAGAAKPEKTPGVYTPPSY